MVCLGCRSWLRIVLLRLLSIGAAEAAEVEVELVLEMADALRVIILLSLKWVSQQVRNRRNLEVVRRALRPRGDKRGAWNLQRPVVAPLCHGCRVAVRSLDQLATRRSNSGRIPDDFVAFSLLFPGFVASGEGFLELESVDFGHGEAPAPLVLSLQLDKKVALETPTAGTGQTHSAASAAVDPLQV